MKLVVAGSGMPPCKPEFAAEINAAKAAQGASILNSVPVDTARMRQLTWSAGALVDAKATDKALKQAILEARTTVAKLRVDLLAVEQDNAKHSVRLTTFPVISASRDLPEVDGDIVVVTLELVQQGNLVATARTFHHPSEDIAAALELVTARKCDGGFNAGPFLKVRVEAGFHAHGEVGTGGTLAIFVCAQALVLANNTSVVSDTRAPISSILGSRGDAVLAVHDVSGAPPAAVEAAALEGEEGEPAEGAGREEGGKEGGEADTVGTLDESRSGGGGAGGLLSGAASTAMSHASTSAALKIPRFEKQTEASKARASTTDRVARAVAAAAAAPAEAPPQGLLAASRAPQSSTARPRGGGGAGKRGGDEEAELVALTSQNAELSAILEALQLDKVSLDERIATGVSTVRSFMAASKALKDGRAAVKAERLLAIAAQQAPRPPSPVRRAPSPAAARNPRPPSPNRAVRGGFGSTMATRRAAEETGK